MAEFEAWAKTPRLYRDITITEKIDGTNAGIIIEEYAFGESASLIDDPNLLRIVFGPDNPDGGMPDKEYLVHAQSRKRLINLDSDNYGFASWVHANAATLVTDLGPGRHFGEWWGQGIQRRYGVDRKVFSLFNTEKWGPVDFTTPNLSVVPMIYTGVFSEEAIRHALGMLRVYGSYAADFNDPEGICIFHKASGQIFKVLLENDDVPKGLVA